ncbi:MAG: hypothetical protein AB7P04_00025 [Bacteriovoracia bacterium]
MARISSILIVVLSLAWPRESDAAPRRLQCFLQSLEREWNRFVHRAEAERGGHPTAQEPILPDSPPLRQSAIKTWIGGPPPPDVTDIVDRLTGYTLGMDFHDWGTHLPIPHQGYKIHVSATEANALELAETILPLLKDMNVEHKIMSKVDYLEKSGATQVGKFITIYPVSDRQAVEVARAVDQALLKKGIREFKTIPGEKQVGKSGGVFVRWGQFTSGDDILGLLKTDAQGNILDREGKVLHFQGRPMSIYDTHRKIPYDTLMARRNHIIKNCNLMSDTRGAYKPDWFPGDFPELYPETPAPQSR